MTSRPGRVPSTRSDSQPATHRANPRPDDMTRRKTAGRKTDGKDGRAQPLFAAARDQGHAWFRLRRLRRSVANVHDGARDCTAGPVQHGLVRRRRRGGGLPCDRELGRRPTGRSLDRPAGPSSGVAAQPGGAHRGAVSYTHLRAHETRHDLVCRLLLSSTPFYSSAASDVYKRQAAAPLVGRWIDRLGQARVLLPSLAVHTVGLLTLLTAAHWRTPRWSLFAAAIITGIAIPPVSSCVRARWALVAPDTARLQVAYALESVLDEVIFIVGPVLVTLLATAASPAVAVASSVTSRGPTMKMTSSSTDS